MVRTTASLAITLSSTSVSSGLKYQRLPVLATAYVSPVTKGTNDEAFATGAGDDAHFPRYVDVQALRVTDDGTNSLQLPRLGLTLSSQ